MTAGIVSHRRQRVRSARIGMQECGEDQPQRREARGREIEEIVELRRRPAKGGVTRGQMTDHRVGGVDGLVGRHPWKPEQGAVKARRGHAVGEIFGEALDRRPRHPRIIERIRVAAHDLGNRRAASLQSLHLKRIGHGRNMLIEAPLRDQGARQQRDGDDRKPRRQEPGRQALQGEREQQTDEQQARKREDPVEPAPCLGQALRVEPPFLVLDERAHPHHGMARAPHERGRIAESGLEQGRAESDEDVEAHAGASA